MLTPSGVISLPPLAGNPPIRLRMSRASRASSGVKGVGVAVGTAVAVGVGVGGTAVAVAGGIGTGDGVAVGIGLGVGVAVGMGVKVAVGTGLGVDVAVGMGVAVGGTAVAVGVAVAVGTGLGVDVAVGMGVGVRVGVGVSVAVGLGVAVAVGAGLGVAVAAGSVGVGGGGRYRTPVPDRATREVGRRGATESPLVARMVATLHELSRSHDKPQGGAEPPLIRGIECSWRSVGILAEVGIESTFGMPTAPAEPKVIDLNQYRGELST